MQLIPTEKSLNEIKEIASKMNGRSFHFHSHILYDIRTALGEQEINYLEVGNAYGMTLSLVASHPYTTHCYGVDLGYPSGIEKISHENTNRFKNNSSSFTQYIGNSRDAVIIDAVRNNPGVFDFIFIDGDHSEAGVTADFENYSPFLKSGGFLVFDDYLDKWDCPNVKIGIDKIVHKYGHQYNIIGTLTYDIISNNQMLFKHPINNEPLTSNNLFIMVKK
jgi:hypothetical protein